jgi:hypothetical protein
MKYIKITRSDVGGSYIERKENLPNMVEGEFDDLEDLAPGTTITLTVVEMPEEEYANLPEFTGW